MFRNRWTHRVALAASGALLLPALATAQLSSQHTLDRAGARRVMDAAIAEAQRLGAPGGAIAIVDDGGHPILLERLDGTFDAGALISIGKARTAATFRRPTRAFEELINKGRTAMATLPDFTPLIGGVPITVGGQVVGAIGVSGAASADQDELIAIAGAAAAEQLATTATAAVTHLDRERVRGAFAQGAPLHEVGGPAGYKVHASRRDAPGEAEVHERETDIIYVLDGAATFVTGGRLEGAKTTAPGEVRGPTIAGGEARALEAGDVVVVPSGTPHWFREVAAPFLYYVVKVAS
jgi:glc operon protein GlcG